MTDTFADLIARARPLIASAPVSDALDEHGFRRQILPPSIRPVDERTVLFGPVRTGSYRPVWEHIPNIYDLEIALVDDLKPGEVCVMACAGNLNIGPWGELLSTRARYLDAAGFLTDGSVRDVAAIRAMGFPVFAGALSPADTQHRGMMAAKDVPVRIGETDIAPGDVIVGDVDGVVVVPRAAALQVLATALDKITGERHMRADIEAGMTLADAFKKHGLL
ncbi:4-hydroxy-4-methyl-2-oxoglutarate aldolase [bacterium YEK0313]|nr:4-hydroxy-4-methyl-2-oxoglutarate aldolase [bacterium YEK0313]